MCTRLREARILAGMTISALSRSLKMSRETLKNYEYGRTAVRFDVGERICAVVNCNQRWLATGQLPMHPHFTISEPLLLALDRPRFRFQTFSKVYDAFLANRFEERFELLARSYWKTPAQVSPASREPDLPGIGFEATSARYFLAQLLGKKLSSRAARFPDEVFAQFESDLDKLAQRYEKKYRKEIEALTERVLFNSAAEYVELENEIEGKLGIS